MKSGTPADATESQVLAVLRGTPVDQVAAKDAMDPTDLADAIDRYRAAGRAAIEAPAHDWYQLRIQFTDWNSAEMVVATRLGPWLKQAQETGLLTHWWFLRKHPHWRLRCRPTQTATTADVRKAIGPRLDILLASGGVQQWSESLYEPEVLAFGGPKGIDIAHDLFTHDSLGVLTYLQRADAAAAASVREAVGRRELSILLCTTMLRSARQDDHEQGDIWHRIVQLRPLASEPAPALLRGMTSDLQRLLRTDPASVSTLQFATAWFTGFAAAGNRLADTARDGILQRGLRDVLAHHVIFHWNRLGLPTYAQAVLARAARETLMNPL